MNKERPSLRRLLTLGILAIVLFSSCTLIPSTGNRPHHIALKGCDWTLSSGRVFNATPITTDYKWCADLGLKLKELGLVSSVRVEPIP